MEVIFVEKDEGDTEFIKTLLHKKIGEIKFLITQEARECICRLFIGLRSYGVFFEQAVHSSDSGFIGAGVLINGVAEWGSYTCLRALNHDRPHDPSDADKILVEFQETITSVLSRPSQTSSTE